MITIHSTKKLLAKLPVNEQGLLPLRAENPFVAAEVPQAPSPLGSWHANLLTMQRRNCLLFVHDATRFPLFIPALTKPDFANLDWWFADALMNTLLKCGADDVQMDKAGAALQRLQFDAVTDRSVQGTMNRMAQEVEISLCYDYSDVSVAEITGHRLSAWLAHRPCTTKGQKGFIWPEREFLALIDSLPEAAQKPEQKPGQKPMADSGLPDNVVLLNPFRKK